jgi:hypothetical protein
MGDQPNNEATAQARGLQTSQREHPSNAFHPNRRTWSTGTMGMLCIDREIYFPKGTDKSHKQVEEFISRVSLSLWFNEIGFDSFPGIGMVSIFAGCYPISIPHNQEPFCSCDFIENHSFANAALLAIIVYYLKVVK